jgi:hypothetical protein
VSTGTNDAVLSGSGDNDDVASPDGLTEGDAAADGVDDGSTPLEPSPPAHEARKSDAPTIAMTI